MWNQDVEVLDTKSYNRVKNKKKEEKNNGGPKSSMNFKNWETRARPSKRTREQVESVFFVLSYKATAILNAGSRCVQVERMSPKGKNQMAYFKNLTIRVV